MKKFAFLLLISSVISTSWSQTNYCGTNLTESDLVWLRNFQQNYTATDGAERGGTIYNVPLKVHIVGTDEGSGYYSLSYLYTAVCELNERYAETGFYFYIYGDLNYINETDYYEHDWYDGSDMMQENNVNDLVNIYFVADPAGNCGYFSPGDNAVAVAKSCAMPGGTTISHELGHFFSLPHTFYGWEGGTPDLGDQEWVNGANCNSAADGFCDTPPDYLNYRWNCPGPSQTDPHGDTFLSDGSLYMSYSNDDCTSRFSNEQMDAMVANLLGPRNDLLDYPDPVYTDVTTTPVLLDPLDDAIDIAPNYAVFKWTSAEGASEYDLQISYSPGFTAIAFDLVTTDTFGVVHDLDLDKIYYWRVKPLAPLNTCEGYTNGYSFTTATVFSGIEENALLGTFAINPNPVQAGELLNIRFETDHAFNGNIQLFDITGKEILSNKFNANGGVSNYQLAIPSISEGIYVMVISDGIRSETSKIIITK